MGLNLISILLSQRQDLLLYLTINLILKCRGRFMNHRKELAKSVSFMVDQSGDVWTDTRAEARVAAAAAASAGTRTTETQDNHTPK